MHFLRTSFITIILLFNCWSAFAQFPPAAGQPGSTAIFRDSSICINWAKNCGVSVGYVNIADTSVYYAGSNKANYGTSIDGIGKADDHVVSLGDGGSATLSFDPPVRNGNGFDFAVFENGLNDNFLELAFIEVSSDSIRFVRFPAVSLTQDTNQVQTFGLLDPVKINNLAGKYRVLYGTPFDLDELKDSTGIDLMHIRYIKIIDVVGSLDPLFSSADIYGNKINDPWPTPWNTGGFDLDGVGVINENTQLVDLNMRKMIRIFPNPVNNEMEIGLPDGQPVVFEIQNLQGEMVMKQGPVEDGVIIDISFLPSGMYIGFFKYPDGTTETRKIIKI